MIQLSRVFIAVILVAAILATSSLVFKNIIGVAEATHGGFHIHGQAGSTTPIECPTPQTGSFGGLFILGVFRDNNGQFQGSVDAHFILTSGRVTFAKTDGATFSIEGSGRASCGQGDGNNGPFIYKYTVEGRCGDGVPVRVDVTSPIIAGGNYRGNILCIPAANSAPVANAGADQTVKEGSVVTLDGSRSTDPNGDTLTYSWAQTSGTPVTLSDKNAVRPTFTAPSITTTEERLNFELTVDDRKGGISKDSVTIILQDIPDTTPRTINVPANIIAEATSASGAVVTYTVTATDEVDGDVSDSVSCTPASGSTFPLVQTTVQCTATDTAGNTGTGSFTVTIQDTTPPAITVPGGITEEATGPNGAAVTFEVSAEDLVDGPVDVNCGDYSSGDTFPLGQTTTVTCTAQDSKGNSAQESFTITVQDTTAPDVEITGAVDRSSSEIADGGRTPIPYIRITFEATDAVGIDSIQCSLDGGAFTSCTSPKVYDRLSRGSHEVTVRATDATGNTGEDEFAWTVAAPPARAGAGGQPAATEETTIDEEEAGEEPQQPAATDEEEAAGGSDGGTDGGSTGGGEPAATTNEEEGGGEGTPPTAATEEPDEGDTGGGEGTPSSTEEPSTPAGDDIGGGEGGETVEEEAVGGEEVAE